MAFDNAFISNSGKIQVAFLRSLFVSFMLFCAMPFAFCQKSPGDSKAVLLAALKDAGSDTNRVRLLYELGNHYLYLPGEKKSDLDSAITFFQRAINASDKIRSDEWHYKILVSIGVYHLETGNIDAGRRILQETIKFYQRTGAQNMEANSWELLGGYLVNNKLNKYQSEGLAYYERAKDLYKKTGNQFKIIEINIGKAIVLVNERKYLEAEVSFLAIHNGFKQLKYYGADDGIVLDWLALIASLRSDFEAELHYALENLEILQKHPENFSDIRQEALFFRLSGLYREVGNIAKSEFYARKQLLISLKLKKDYTYSLDNLVPSLLKQDKPFEALRILKETVEKTPPDAVQKIDVYQLFGKIYAAMHSYKRAEAYYRLVIEHYERMDPKRLNSEYRYFAYQSISAFFVSIKQFKKAERYLDDLKAKPPHVSPLQRSKIAILQSKVDSAAGRYFAALQYYQIYKRLNDSIFNVKKSQQISKQELSFENRQTQNKIKLLAARNRFNLAQEQRANLQRNIIASGILILLIISGITIISVRNKIKTSRLLTNKKNKIDQQNEDLQVLLKEKETLIEEKEILLFEKDTLLKEVHHRVKNNLQIVMSLLSTQLEYLESEDAVIALEDSQQRLQAIALIHQKIYHETGGVSIQMHPYITDMVADLENIFNVSKRNISIKTIVDEIDLDIDLAVPVGLILNEAITNAIKYAFIEMGGTIVISMVKSDNVNHILTISDDGKGLPDDFDFEKVNSLGMVIMKGLGTQIGGSFEVINDNGLQLSVKFPVKEKQFLSRV
ncbi:histidine kinase dimerization/phosphoacceptor domain -containing protein [Mucilaginibacter psychrotolerans]|uniref:histidine kinase n=1 Tax=Mucilaginibacter psychrotolerans TaxID=1524096 RepID=A0A4Y8SGM6_9SPHI|nr:histidine kinase dimerization/phosphoacceptor domain -containing protein [Mucilaginibacter psychrotolerans]TFF37780.1 hypothetical protein E2R66_11480 [Mucilaginibacter psychrotolerans]